MEVKFKKIVKGIAFLVVMCSMLITNINAKAEELTSSQMTEKQLEEIINIYGEENIIFENGIVLSLGDEVNVYDVIDELSEEAVMSSYDSDILTIDNKTIVASNEGTTFLIIEENSKYHVLEVYVEDPSIMTIMDRVATESRSNYLVFIDVGHGGKDPGASGNGIIEKNYNLNIGLKVRERLRAQGIEVVMNRETDIYVNYKDTATMANNANPDVFVSLHSNASTSVAANGIETFYSKNIDIPLGTEIQNRLISSTGAANRGLKKDTYYVTNHTIMPAVLVENGFVTNVKEAEKMKTESYQEAIIKSITDGIVAYLKGNVNIDGLSSRRIFGDNRYETSYKLFENGWDTSETVVLVTGADYADALTSAPLAAKYDAPILLVRNTTLNNQTMLKDILKNKGVTNAVIVGGTSALNSNIEAELSALGITSTRIAGSDRYSTSVKVANELKTQSGEVAIAYGLDFADGLSISAVAAIKQMPILLTPTNSLPKVVSEYIKGNGINKSYIIGSESVVSKNVENSLLNSERLGGANRYETNVKVFNKFKADLSLKDIYLASALDFPDALSATALAARSNSFVVLTNPNVGEKNIKFLFDLNRSEISNVYVLGSNVVIKDKVLSDLRIN